MLSSLKNMESKASGAEANQMWRHDLSFLYQDSAAAKFYYLHLCFSFSDVLFLKMPVATPSFNLSFK